MERREIKDVSCFRYSFVGARQTLVLAPKLSLIKHFNLCFTSVLFTLDLEPSSLEYFVFVFSLVMTRVDLVIYSLCLHLCFFNGGDTSWD